MWCLSTCLLVFGIWFLLMKKIVSVHCTLFGIPCANQPISLPKKCSQASLYFGWLTSCLCSNKFPVSSSRIAPPNSHNTFCLRVLVVKWCGLITFFPRPPTCTLVWWLPVKFLIAYFLLVPLVVFLGLMMILLWAVVSLCCGFDRALFWSWFIVVPCYNAHSELVFWWLGSIVHPWSWCLLFQCC